MERLLTRISSSETKLEIESSRINKSENLFENNFENINGITSKLKNQQDIIDEMRRMLFARISKVESAVRNNKPSGTQNSFHGAYQNGLNTLKEVNRTMTSKVNSRDGLATPLSKNSLSKLQIDDNLDHTQYLEHLDQNPNEIINRQDRGNNNLDQLSSNRTANRNRDMTPTPNRNNTQHQNANDEMLNVINDLESLKIRFDTLNQKQHEVMSQLNQDKANIT
jgi:hypothetical protein